MIRLILVLTNTFDWLIRLLGGDPAQFRAILETKLTLDARRPMVGFANRKDRDSGGAFTGAMVFYAIIGAFLGGILWRVGSPLVGLTVVHTTVLVMLTMTLIADFTNVLLDTTDNAILQPRPVSGRTLFLARTAHICTYLGLLGISLSLAAMAIGTLRWGYLFPVVYLLTLAGGLTLATCLASVFYLVALRITGRERIRDIVLYIQIAFSIFVFGGYQFLPRLVDMTQLEGARIDLQRWIYFYPPAWLAAPLDLLAGNTGRPQMILTLLACTVPPLAFLLVTRGLATRFNQMLAAMEMTTQRDQGTKRIDGRLPLAAKLSRLVSRNPRPKAIFEFVWTVLARDRLFKARTYPSIAMLLVVPLSLMLSDRRGIAVVLRELPSTQWHLLVLYMACMTFAPAILQIRYSPFWQAAWVYESLPIERPGEILLYTVAALLLRFVLPGFAIVSSVLLAVWGLRILPDIMLAFLATIVVALLEAILLGRHLPFSEQFGVREGSGRMGKNLLLMVVAAGLGGLHYLLMREHWAVPLAILGTGALILVIGRVYRATTWDAVAHVASEPQ